MRDGSSLTSSSKLYFSLVNVLLWQNWGRIFIFRFSYFHPSVYFCHLPLWQNISEGLYQNVQLISYSYQEGLSFVPKYEQLHHVTCYDKSWTESFRINQGTVQTYFNHFYNTLFSNSIHWHLYADLKIGKYNSQRINFD